MSQQIAPNAEQFAQAAKIIAATSLFLWIGVMFWGRMLPFIGNAF